MKRLASLPGLIEAQLASDLLSSAGIPNHLFNVNAAGALGELPFVQAFPEIWVDEAWFERARDLLDAARQIRSDERACPHCGESNPEDYLSCWHCRAALPGCEPD